MKEYIEETLIEFLENINIRLSDSQIKELSSDLDSGISHYQDMVSGSIPYWNPAENKVEELKKEISTMHTNREVKYLKSEIEVHKREVRRLRLMTDDLQRKLNNI